MQLIQKKSRAADVPKPNAAMATVNAFLVTPFAAVSANAWGVSIRNCCPRNRSQLFPLLRVCRTRRRRVTNSQETAKRAAAANAPHAISVTASATGREPNATAAAAA